MDRSEVYVHDCCCGTGRMLLAAADVNPRVELVGQDIDARCAKITAINVGLRGICRSNSPKLDKCRYLWHSSLVQMATSNDSTQRLFEEISKRIDDLRQDIHEFKSETREEFKDTRATLRVHLEKLDKIYDARHALKVTWGWEWGAISLLIAVAASGATAVIAFLIQPT